ncbi:hypothetical protein GN244_ATG16017 [Phytophthora infestans]|uniref:Uncharacterized protein n=1 Tax=Phytophthora infestans TaxID=4787 RepID=A0A833SIQ8_PHYIN|nr:hypothetical protein GN244_ATG16017 [Phytophthora infestans]KAF4150359.1 hypothetical protein GN958_ATG00416 [Phytophthora infestans]
MDEAEVLCGWCGAPVSDWKRYGFELQEAGCRLQVKLSRRRRGNRAVRQALCYLYLCLKSGSMQGNVPKCQTTIAHDLAGRREGKYIIKLKVALVILRL